MSPSVIREATRRSASSRRLIGCAGALAAVVAGALAGVIVPVSSSSRAGPVAVFPPTTIAGEVTVPPTVPPTVSPTVPTPPTVTASFPAGIWKGTAVATGMISTEIADAFYPEPIILNFEVEIAPDGSVVTGVWEWSGEVDSAAPEVQGIFTFSGSGTLSGTADRIVMEGVTHMSGTVTVQGQEYPVENDMPAAGGFGAKSSSCNVVSGDLATEGRETQAGSGVSTNVQAPFSAHRIGNAGDEGVPGFGETYAELVVAADNLLAMGIPPAADVVALVQRAESFYLQVYGSVNCPGSDPNLLPGKQHYSYFVELLGQLLLTVLVDPSVYSADDLHVLALAAVRIGVIGNAAPDPTMAAQVLQVLHDAVETKLAEATTQDNKADCSIVLITATSMGFTDLVAPAQACIGG